MKVKKSIKALFLALISTISVSAFAESNGTLVFVDNSSPLSMNVQVPTTEIAVPIIAPGRSFAQYGFYPLKVYRPFNIWDNRPKTGGFGQMFDHSQKYGGSHCQNHRRKNASQWQTLDRMFGSGY